MKKFIYFTILVFVSVILNSCVTAPKPPVYPPKEVYPRPSEEVLRQDVFHQVGPGETVWRICKAYDVNIKDVMERNHLKEENELKMGQGLLIPLAAPIKPVVSLYPSEKWQYIIIHHSATDEGNALNFYKSHRLRGWENLGYHFVIDNGTEGKQEGQIETSPRWIKQQDGAHCKADNMNCRGIGICLVGDFSKERVSLKQLDSLVYLVNVLRNYYHIPVNNIFGHGQVHGAKTECPGKNFPWEEFYKRLEQRNLNEQADKN